MIVGKHLKHHFSHTVHMFNIFHLFFCKLFMIIFILTRIVCHIHGTAVIVVLADVITLDVVVAVVVARLHNDAELRLQGLVVAEADELALAVLRHKHGHDELLGAHAHFAWSGAVHEIVDALGTVCSRVRVPHVAEGGEPGMEAGVRVAVRQRIGKGPGQDGVGLAGP